MHKEYHFGAVVVPNQPNIVPEGETLTLKLNPAVKGSALIRPCGSNDVITMKLSQFDYVISSYATLKRYGEMRLPLLHMIPFTREGIAEVNEKAYIINPYGKLEMTSGDNITSTGNFSTPHRLSASRIKYFKNE